MSKSKTGDLYRLDFVDGKSYIGACTCGAEKQYHKHQRYANKGSNRPVHVAWRKYGEPKLVILKKSLLENVLWGAEKMAILRHNTKVPLGYNGHYGSDKAPGFLLKKHTDEQKEIFSRIVHDRYQNPEAREKHRQANLGRKQTDAVRKNCRLAALKRHREKPFSEKTKEKIRQTNLGKKHTEETKLKMRQSHAKRLDRLWPC